MSTPAKSLGLALVLACVAAIACPTRSLATDPPAAKPRPTLKVEILKRFPSPPPGADDPPDAQVHRALEARVRVELVDAPLGDVCHELARQLGINVIVDREALEEMDLGPETPLTFSCGDLRVKQMLRAALERYELKCIVDDEVLQITSPEREEECRALRLYDVADLVTITREDGSYDFDFGPLVDLITGTVEPASWVDMGGSGTCESFEADCLQILVVKQIGPVHDGIESLLANLRAHIAAKAPTTKPKADSRPLPVPRRPDVAPPEKTPATPDERILHALRKRISIDLKERPLTELVARLEKSLAVPVRLDVNSLEEMGLAPDTLVTIEASDISARSALALALWPLDLDWTIRDGALVICERGAAEDDRLVKLYDVADLVEHPGADPPGRDFEPLVSLIMASVAPDFWQDMGGSGTIGVFDREKARVLVISTTWQIHEEIKDLLAMLRQTRREGHGRPIPQRMKPAASHQAGGGTVPRSVEVRFASYAAPTAAEPPATDEPSTDKPTSDKPAPEPTPSLEIEVLQRPAAPGSAAADSPEARIERALESRIRVHLVDAPLDDFCRALAKKLGINVVVDPEALERFNLPPDEWLSFSCRDLPVKTMLRHTLRTIDFAWVVDCEVLLVTTRETVEEHTELKVYDVADLVTVEQPDGTYRLDFNPLMDLIIDVVEPGSWLDVGGNGACEPFGAERIQVLVVRQSRSVHKQIDQFLAALRSHLPKPPAGNRTMAGAGSQPGAEGNAHSRPTEGLPVTAEERIYRLLRKRVSVDLDNVPLTEFAKRMEKLLGIPVLVDTDNFKDLELLPDTPVTLHLRDVPAHHVLALAIRPLDLWYAIRKDRVWLSPGAPQDEWPTPRIYDVTDLVERPADRPPLADFAPLIELVTWSVAPDSWIDMGGNGRITPFEGGGARVLVIRQTWQVHDEIESLLARLRKVRDEGHGRPLPARTRKAAHARSGMPAVAGPGGLAPRWSSVRPPAAVGKNSDRDELVRGGNQFAFDLYARLRDRAKGQNLFFSPMSVSTALAMAQAGARGYTADEMARAVHFTLPPERLHPACASLLEASGSGWGHELTVANRFWVQQDYPVLDEFSRLLDQYYGAEAQSVDFSHRSGAAWRTIDRWTAQATRNRLAPLAIYDGGLFGPLLPRETTLLLTNAVYFKGRWSAPFDRSATKGEPFQTDTITKSAYMMTGVDYDSQYAEIDDPPMEILRRPYLGGDLAMVVLLPPDKPGALAAVEARLTADNLGAWLAKLKLQKVEVHLPKLRFDTAYRLNEPLAALGMKAAFETRADFSGIDGKAGPLWLLSVSHNASVLVDEQGTEAAADTIGGLGGGTSPVEPPPVFRADHPFVFLIHDRRTGSILFLGRLVDPERVTPSRL